MATSSLAIPTSGMLAPENWRSSYSLDQIPKQIKGIWDKYGTYITKYAKTSRIPPAVLTAFIYVESGGKAQAVSPTNVNVGLMQWNYNNGHKTIENEYKADRLSEDETNAIKALGKKYGFTFINGKLSRSFTKAEAMDPELNILVGSIILGQLANSMYLGQKEPVKWGMENDVIRLDRIIVVYNQGGGDVKVPNSDGIRARRGKYNPNTQTFTSYKTVTDLYNAVQVGESKKYIQKMLGKHGALDIIQNYLGEISMETI